jgi:hypothetical protein
LKYHGTILFSICNFRKKGGFIPVPSVLNNHNPIGQAGRAEGLVGRIAESLPAIVASIFLFSNIKEIYLKWSTGRTHPSYLLVGDIT